MSTIIFSSPIFGPIQSRRLGVSLGVNLLPGDGKYCSFDCIYCECGFNKDHKTKSSLPTREEVKTALESTLQKMKNESSALDVITFAGNGEPTIHPHFADIIDDTLKLRDTYFPYAKVSVLSNAVHIGKPNVFEALQKVDNNILKLDTVDEDYIRWVDRPVARYSLPQTIELLKAFKGNCIIQTMFMKGEFMGKDVNNTTNSYVLPWIKVLKDIAPKQVMIYTIDRETPGQGLEKATPEELNHIRDLLVKEGLNVSVSY
ncbi:radical SAM protein [Bacteroides sp. 519]|uniref:radical SAM protein n=1 Tax=Bacteroides sp. 519 TaxID=2302937 RepID=UPI0013CF856A|nr:radical SAM protein [Bacteroides sp. 519]NDV57617.1 radical SAM protein [Bacteroides sp. 519]